MPRKPLTIQDVRQFVQELPGVQEGTMHGSPSWKLNGKLLACPAIHKSAEPDSLMVQVAPADRERLLAAEPEVYYVTDHYANISVVLVRLTRIDQISLRQLLKSGWELLDAAGSKPGGKPRRPMAP
jgi:hypothetical protein